MTQQKDKNNQKGGQSVSQRTLIPRKQDRVQTKEREFGRKEDGKVVIVMRITSQKKKEWGKGGNARGEQQRSQASAAITSQTQRASQRSGKGGEREVERERERKGPALHSS